MENVRRGMKMSGRALKGIEVDFLSSQIQTDANEAYEPTVHTYRWAQKVGNTATK